MAIRRGDGGAFIVEVRWAKGFHATGWDMYGTDREHGACIAARIPLDDLAPQAAAFAVSVAATGDDGGPLPYALTRAVVETFAGRRCLHLQANGARAAVEGKAARLEFTVAPRR